MPRLTIAHWGPAAVLTALVLTGCSAGMTGLAPGPLAYQHSNAIAPAGYSESAIGPDRYRIEVKGPANTPRERLEKIAATRAAEIGKENKLGYFKIEQVQHNTHCEKYIQGGQPGSASSGAKKRTAYAVMTADVSYAKSPTDPSFIDSRTTFDQYRAELDQDQSAPAPLDPAALAAHCPS
jgi:hypothetical protein